MKNWTTRFYRKTKKKMKCSRAIESIEIEWKHFEFWIRKKSKKKKHQITKSDDEIHTFMNPIFSGYCTWCHCKKKNNYRIDRTMHGCHRFVTYICQCIFALKYCSSSSSIYINQGKMGVRPNQIWKYLNHLSNITNRTHKHKKCRLFIMDSVNQHITVMDDQLFLWDNLARFKLKIQWKMFGEAPITAITWKKKNWQNIKWMHSMKNWQMS